MDADQVVKRFKIELLRKVPFYGDVVVRLQFIPSSNVKIAATDGCTVWYNPRSFSEREETECRYILMHEIMHVILRHGARNNFEGRDHRCWNVACDIAVNAMVDSMIGRFAQVGIGLRCPADAVRSNIPDKMTVESLYELILAEQPASFRHADKKKVPIYIRKHYYGSNNTAPTFSVPNGSEDLLGSDISPEENDANDEYIRRLLLEAIKGARGDTGSFPIPPSVYALSSRRRVDWKTLLRSFLTQEISDDSSYATPERKYLHMDLILPGHTLSEETLSEIWVFIDSSGSISSDTMESFLSELHHLVRQFQCLVNLAYWDTSVTEVYRKIRTEKELLACLPKHSGGTDINCVYRWIREYRVRPDVMLILTDGYFGRLDTAVFDRRLAKKTVLVLDSSIDVNEDMRRIGKVARLKQGGSL